MALCMGMLATLARLRLLIATPLSEAMAHEGKGKRKIRIGGRSLAVVVVVVLAYSHSRIMHKH